MASLLGVADRVIALTFVIGARQWRRWRVCCLERIYGVINYIGFYGRDESVHAACWAVLAAFGRAMIGSLILGVAEALSSAYLSTGIKMSCLGSLC